MRFTCGNTDAIEKGALLFLVDPNTVSGAALQFRPFAGIAAEEKAASDGATTLGLYKNGKFDLKTGDAVNAGDLLSLSGSNILRKATAADILSGCVVGKALELAAVDEVIVVEVGRY